MAEPTWEPEQEGDVILEEKKETAPPQLYRVLLHNDDYTTQDFVVMILESIFRHPARQAYEIMMEVHLRGVGVAGIYPHEVAETKVGKVLKLAREYEFPLLCTMEPD